MRMLPPRCTTRAESNLVVWQTRSREDGDLLSSRNGIHHVNCGDTGLNHLLGVYTGVRVDGRALYRNMNVEEGVKHLADGRRTINVQVILCEYFGAIVNRLARTVEDTPEHVLRDGELHAATGELNMGSLNIDTGRALEDLHDRLLPLYFKDLTATLRAIGEGKLYNLIVRGKLAFDISAKSGPEIHTYGIRSDAL